MPIGLRSESFTALAKGFLRTVSYAQLKLPNSGVLALTDTPTTLSAGR